MSRESDALLDGLVSSPAITVAEVRSWLEAQDDAKQTLRDAIPTILARWSEHPRDAYAVKQYRASVRRLLDGEPADLDLGLDAVAGLGNRRIDQITRRDLEILTAQIRTYLGLAKVRRSEREHKPLRSHDPRSHGGGAEQNMIDLIHKLFGTATELRLVSTDPSVGLRKAHQDPDPFKTYQHAGQLQDVFNLVMYSGDWELDQRLVDISCATGWRGRTCLAVRLGDIDLDGGFLRITEKFDKTRRIPVSLPRLRDLDAFARVRGACHSEDPVFCTTAGMPITVKHLESLYDRVHAHCPWTAGHAYGLKWHRDLLANAVAHVGGWEVAVTLLGHSLTVRGATHHYVRHAANYGQLVAALEKVLGPMATAQPFWAVQKPDFAGLFPPPDEQDRP